MIEAAEPVAVGMAATSPRPGDNPTATVSFFASCAEEPVDLLMELLPGSRGWRSR